MPSALVTGVTGQDGSYLAEALTARGVRVHALVRPGDVVDRDLGLVVHRGELDDGQALLAALDASGPDEVYHLAAISSVAASWVRPLDVQRVNAVGSGTLLAALGDWSRSNGTTPRLVNASSAEIFGAAAHVPQDESTPIRPLSPYGATKAYAHLLVGAYRERGLHASNLVLFNHESPRRPATFLSRKTTKGVADIAAGRADELLLGNLDVRRDWGWAPDYVAAMVAAASHPTPGDYVIATGISHSVRDFVVAAFDHVGLPWERYVRTVPELARPAEVREQRGDSGRARRVLGWAPTVGFAELVGRMVQVDL